MLNNTIRHFSKIKIKKSSNWSEIATQPPKTFENPCIIDIKLAIIEYPKISCKLSKFISRLKIFSIEIKKSEKTLDAKITKRSEI